MEREHRYICGRSLGAAAEKMGQRILVYKWKDKKWMQAARFVPDDFDDYGWQNLAKTKVKEDKQIVLALKNRHYRLLEKPATGWPK